MAEVKMSRLVAEYGEYVERLEKDARKRQKDAGKRGKEGGRGRKKPLSSKLDKGKKRDHGGDTDATRARAAGTNRRHRPHTHPRRGKAGWRAYQGRCPPEKRHPTWNQHRRHQFHRLEQKNQELSRRPDAAERSASAAAIKASREAAVASMFSYAATRSYR
jgi:hypothetical protein